MIYFIVNNDFHVEHIEHYLNDFKDKDFTIIRIPYSLKNDCTHLTTNIFTFETPFRESMGIFQKFIVVHSLKRKIKQSLSFAHSDTIILLTEYDPLNQFIIYLAKNRGAQISLLQEGIATYYTNMKAHSKSLNYREKLKLFMMRYVFGFYYLNFVKQGNNLFPQINDQYIDNIFLYFDFRLDRKIKATILTSPYMELSDLNQDFALFLNQPLYESYLSETEYLELVNKEISIISNDYKKTVFKFHPRDHKNIRKKIMTSLTKSKIIFVDDAMNLDQVIEYYKPLNIYSFFSDALLRLELQGCKTHYLFSKQENLLNHDVLKNINIFLNNITNLSKNNENSFLKIINKKSIFK